jgi:hypothetical protein
MIWASCKFNGCELGYLPVLNPGRWHGKTWLIEHVGDVPIRLVVEAASIHDALVVLSNDPDFGEGFHFVHVQDDDLPVDSFHQVPKTQTVRVHGQGHCSCPYPVRYYGEGYPDRGIDPRQYALARFN